MPKDESGAWHCTSWLRKFRGDWTFEQIQAGLAGEPYETIESEGNMLVNAGILVMLQALTGRSSPTPFSTANARIAVGDSPSSVVNTQTALQATTNQVRAPMDTGYPKVGIVDGLLSDNLAVFSATFGIGVAEWATGWQEWGIFNASLGGAMLNRKVENKGVKPTSTTWNFQVQVQIS